MEEEANLVYHDSRGRHYHTYEQDIESDAETTLEADVCREEDQAKRISSDELIYRLKHSFLDHEYDIEKELTRFMQLLLPTNLQEECDKVLALVKFCPLPITQKLQLTRMIRSHMQQTRIKRDKNEYGRQVIKQRDTLRETLSSWQIWETAISNLQAYFGSNVASYFNFLRTLLYLNMLIAVMQVGLVAVPQVLNDGGFITKENATRNGHFGAVSQSIMFYGAYSRDILDGYNIPLAYLITWLVANIICLVFIATLMHLRYRKSKLAESGEDYKFAWRLLCDWDHSITNKDGVKDRKTAVTTDFKEVVREEKSVQDIVLCQRLRWYLARVVSNVIVLGILAGSGYLIFYVTDETVIPEEIPDIFEEQLRKYRLPVTVAGLKFVVPLILYQLVRIEGWHPRVATKFTLVRTTLFYVASLSVFVLSLYTVTQKEDNYCSPSHATVNLTISTEGATNATCWESDIGEEIFKVMLLDLGITIAAAILFQIFRAVQVRFHCCNFLGYGEFDVIACVLDIIYGQGLIWLGMYFSPLLALFGVVKLVIVFYIQYFVAKFAMVPPKELFKASKSGNLYLAILLINLFICMFLMSYCIIELKPSISCGPFPGQCRSHDEISDLIGELPTWLEDGLNYIRTPAIVVPIIAFLLMVIIYYKAKSSSYHDLILELRKQLIHERKVEKRKVFATARAILVRQGSLRSVASSKDLPRTPTIGTKMNHAGKNTLEKEVNESKPVLYLD